MFHDRRVSFFAGRKSLVILSTAGFALAAFALSFLLPVRYASNAVLVVRKRDVAEGFVRDVSNWSNTDRMKFLKGRIRSRTALVELIREFEFNKDKQKSKNMDQLVHQMRDNIEITTGSPETSEDYFELRYVGSDPEVAQRIAGTLTNLVVAWDNEALERRANGAVAFLSEELDRLVARMHDQNEKLSQERRTHGEVSAAPLVMEHEMLQTTYRTLFTKLEEARMSESLEMEQKGAQIVVVDPPNLGVPVGPDRLSITGIGALTGFGLGGMAVFGMNRKQSKQSRVLA